MAKSLFKEDTMKNIARMIAVCGILTTIAVAGAAQEPAKNDTKPDYTELSRLIQRIVVGQIPKVIEDNSGWSGSVPVPANLKLPRLKRELIKVGDRWELPHGFWHKIKAWVPE